MCYSLEASVNAGLCLAVVGAATTHKAARHDPRMIGFAAFPLVFSVHQLVEGGVWWSLDHPFEGDESLRYLYTAIAFLVWPVLTPFAAMLAETDVRRKKLWMGMTAFGVVYALYLTALLIGADGIAVSVVKHSLAYDPGFDRPPLIVDLIYLALTIVPLVSFPDNRALRLFGVLVLLTFIYALLHNRAAWYSLWCLSAAVFSLVLSFAIRGETQTLDDTRDSSCANSSP